MGGLHRLTSLVYPVLAGNAAGVRTLRCCHRAYLKQII